MSTDASAWLPRLLLLPAAVDSLVSGAWAILRPDDLFTWLHLSPTKDGLLLCRALGALTVCHVPCLIVAFLRPSTWSGVVVAPLLGRALLAGVWLWLLTADRVRPAVSTLRLLLLHDAVWLPVFITFLFAWRGRAGFIVARRPFSV